MSGAVLMREELGRLGITAAEGARRLEVSKATMSAWLSEAKRPTAARAREIELWSEGRVPAESWWTDEERARVAAREPSWAEQ
jgi:transcriptional regulator with XRE-family HTH domain